MKKRHNLLALLLVLTMLLSACGGQGSVSSVPSGSGSLPAEPEASSGTAAPEAQPFTLGYYASEGFHPYTCENSLNQTVVGLLYDTLVELDGQFQPQPCLAERVTCTISPEAAEVTVAEDGTVTYPEMVSAVTTVTITLRSDVRFWNGDAMTGADVAYSLNQARAEGSIYAGRFANVTQVKASGNLVTVTVNGANADFAALLDIPVIQNGTGGSALPTGTGPYRLNAEGTALQSNGSWWRGEALPLEEIPLYAAKDSDYLLYAFGSGDVSLVSTDLTGSGSLGYNGNYQVRDYPTTVMLYLGCNTAEGTPCSVKEVRSAIYGALDRDKLASRLLSGHAQGASLPVSPSSGDYDAELAATLQAGGDITLPAGAVKELTLLVNTDAQFKQSLAEEIAQELNELGFQVTVSALSWNDYKAAVTAGEYDLYLGEVRLTADFSLDALLEETGTLNFSQYSDPALTWLYDAYRRAGGGTEAASAFFRELANQAPFIPLCFKNYSVLYQWKTLESLTPTQQNLFYQFYSWQFFEAGEQVEEP